MNDKKEISVPSDNTRVYIKPQQPIKIHKANKNEQELNKRKQQFLNANGIKVKIDGSKYSELFIKSTDSVILEPVEEVL